MRVVVLALVLAGCGQEVSTDPGNVVLGTLAGGASGFLGSFVAGIFHITAKRLRNDRLIRRGEPPIKDVIFVTLWPLHTAVGAIAGLCWTWRIDGTWVTGAVAGAGLPALAVLASLVWGLAQLRR